MLARPHAGASNKRATPIPCGSPPSTAALTRLGARKASEMDVALAAALPCRNAVDCRGAGLDLGQPLPPRAIALTSLTRVSERIERTCVRDGPWEQ
jgi:hypothetical protein